MGSNLKNSETHSNLKGQFSELRTNNSGLMIIGTGIDILNIDRIERLRPMSLLNLVPSREGKDETLWIMIAELF